MNESSAGVRQILSASGAVLAARAFSLGAAAIQLPILARLLGPDEFAFIAISTAWATLFTLVGAESVILSFQRFPGTRNARSNYIYARRRLAIWIAALSAVVLACSAALDKVDFGFALAGLGIGISVNRFISVAWLMWSSPWSYAQSLVLGTGLRTGVLVSAILVGAPPYVAVGMAGLVSAIGVIAFSPRSAGTRQATIRPWRRSLGISLALGSASVALLTNTNLVILPHLVPSTDVGQYAAMSQAASLTLGAVLGVILTVLQPRALSMWNAGRADQTKALVAAICHAAVLLCAACLFIALLIGQRIVNLVLGPGYLDLPTLYAMIAMSCIAACGQYLSLLHLLRLDSRRIQKVGMAAAACGIVACVTGALFLGVWGAAIGQLASFGCYMLLMYRKSDIGWSIAAMASATIVSAIALRSLPFTLGVLVLSILLAISLILTARAFRDVRSLRSGPPT